MKIEVELDRLEDYLFWAEPQCGVCNVPYCKDIDCPYKSGDMAKFKCKQAVIEYLKGDKKK